MYMQRLEMRQERKIAPESDNCSFVDFCEYYDEKQAICTRSWGKYDTEHNCKHIEENLFELKRGNIIDKIRAFIIKLW
jgi:hypothetical protein